MCMLFLLLAGKRGWVDGGFLWAFSMLINNVYCSQYFLWRYDMSEILQGGTTEELRKIFLKSHKEWGLVNNPAGFESGEACKHWDKRTSDLMALLRSRDMKV